MKGISETVAKHEKDSNRVNETESFSKVFPLQNKTPSHSQVLAGGCLLQLTLFFKVLQVVFV